MAITDRPEWTTWRNPGGGKARARAGNVLLAEARSEEIDELLAMCGKADPEDAYAAVRLLMQAYVEDGPKPEWQVRLPNALKAFIARSEFFSLVWRTSHTRLDFVQGCPRSFLGEDLAARGLTMDDYERAIDEEAESVRRQVAAMAVPMSAEDCIRAFLTAGGSLERATAEELVSWAKEWRSCRSSHALSQLYDRFINCMPERKVPLQFLINLLGPPDSGDPYQVYYSLNRNSGLVLIADRNGFLEGRKLN